MIHRKRDLITALAAAMLLTATAAGSAAFAHDGSNKRGDPSGSPKPRETQKVQPTKAPRTTLKIDCSKIPTATPTGSAAATTAPSGAAAGRTSKSGGRVGPDRPTILRRTQVEYCSLVSAQKAGANQVGGLLRQLQALNESVAKSSLSDADKAILKAEIDTVIAGLTALKSKLAAESTVEAARADLAAVKQQGKLVQGIKLQIHSILGSLRILATAAELEARIVAFEAQILAAPSGVDTAAAQKYLADMKADVAAAKALVGPLRSQLMGLTLDQIKSGRANPTLAAAVVAVHKAVWIIWRASRDARTVTWILAGKPGFEGKTPKPTVTPIVTPAASPVPTA